MLKSLKRELISAVFAGLQEYVEAVSFQYFIKTRSLISVEEINKQLIFTAEDREETTNMVKVFLFSIDKQLSGMEMQREGLVTFLASD